MYMNAYEGREIRSSIVQDGVFACSVNMFALSIAYLLPTLKLSSSPAMRDGRP